MKCHLLAACLLAALWVVAFGGCSAAAPRPGAGSAMHGADHLHDDADHGAAPAESEGIVRTYKTTPQGDLALEVFLPAGWQASDRRPAIVFFFGGKWARGERARFYPQCRYFASRGIVAVTADYRIATVHGTTPVECVEDARSAIRWLKANAAEFGIDADRVMAGGGSAGGHIAAAAAWCPGPDAPDDDLTISPRPAALVLFNPVLDKVMRVRPARGERLTDQQRQQLTEQISPNHHLNSAGPPTIIFFGSEDSAAFVAAAQHHLRVGTALGNHVELYIADGIGHGFFHNPPWLQATLAQADLFLQSLGHLKSDPGVQAPAKTILRPATVQP